ncbi:MAG TPA: prenyltransferase/squalene oxidase repeat-containing protein, partial [Gemmataceae bacterium]|nr:prenyltransferase/squalene oxidase repeat-containing protein [Gemmataceae bacterium]
RSSKRPETTHPMPPQPYLPRLTARLGDGLLRLPDDFRARHAAFVRRCQAADGGFPGRQGGSDLYYTGFALRSLAVLDALTPDVIARAADFLRNSLAQQASVVDFFSLLYSCLLVQTAGGPDVLSGAPPDWPERVAAALETFRTADGGYARNAGAASGSTYHTFLVGLCCELLGRDVPRPDEIVRFVQSRRRDDGGFAEFAPQRRSGTNSTAAAVGTLQLIGAPIPDDVREAAADLIASRATDEGGLRATAMAPLADLLSTFTGAWTLAELGELHRIDGAAVLSYARSLELPDGGFTGVCVPDVAKDFGIPDEQADVEYTFYGLGAVALLTPPH